MAYRKKTYRRKASKRTFKRKSYAKKRSPLKKMIRREIARGRENKTKQFYQNNDPILGTDDSSLLDLTIFPVAPDSGFLQIDQGVAQGSRIGNEITTKKLIFKGTIIPLPYNAATNPNPRPMQVKMWFLYDKTDPTGVPTPATNGDFFQFGGSNAGFTGTLSDLWKPINTDRYAVLAQREFKVGYGNYVGTYSSIPAQEGAQFYNNNDFKLNSNFKFDLTKHIPKRIKYNDNDSDPTTRSLFCLCVAYNADNSEIVVDRVQANMSWMLDYTYEDA